MVFEDNPIALTDEKKHIFTNERMPIINVKRIKKKKKTHFATPNEITDSGKDAKTRR